MAEVSLPRNAGKPGDVAVAEISVTIAAGQTAGSTTTTKDYNGIVERVEIDPGAALTASATIKGYGESTVAASARELFLNYSVPNPAVERVFQPMVAATDATGAAISYDGTRPIYKAPVVAGKLTIAVSTATAADNVVVRVYVRG